MFFAFLWTNMGPTATMLDREISLPQVAPKQLGTTKLLVMLPLTDDILIPWVVNQILERGQILKFPGGITGLNRFIHPLQCEAGFTQLIVDLGCACQ